MRVVLIHMLVVLRFHSSKKNGDWRLLVQDNTPKIIKLKNTFVGGVLLVGDRIYKVTKLSKHILMGLKGD